MMANNEADLIVFHRNLRIQDNEALSYGSIRQNILGLEVITTNGEIISNLAFSGG